MRFIRSNQFQICLEMPLKARPEWHFASLAVDDNLKCVCNSVASRLILAQLWKMAHGRKSCIIKNAALNWNAWKNVSIPEFLPHFADIVSWPAQKDPYTGCCDWAPWAPWAPVNTVASNAAFSCLSSVKRICSGQWLKHYCLTNT